MLNYCANAGRPNGQSFADFISYGRCGSQSSKPELQSVRGGDPAGRGKYQRTADAENSAWEIIPVCSRRRECGRCVGRPHFFCPKNARLSRLKSREKSEIRKIFMKTRLAKNQKVTEVYYNAKDSTAEVYTHDIN